jgi:hypothetical protein
VPARNKIADLRDHLFETLEALRDDDKPMELKRAHAIATVAKVIVESAKVEVAFIRATGTAVSTGFLPDVDETPVNRQLRAVAGDRR